MITKVSKISKTVNKENGMKFKLNDYHRNVPDNELIDDLKRVASLINKKSCYIGRV